MASAFRPFPTIIYIAVIFLTVSTFIDLLVQQEGSRHRLTNLDDERPAFLQRTAATPNSVMDSSKPVYVPEREDKGLALFENGSVGKVRHLYPENDEVIPIQRPGPNRTSSFKTSNATSASNPLFHFQSNPQTNSSSRLRNCGSGSEFLSVKAGGKWVKVSEQREELSKELLEYLSQSSSHSICYPHGYKDFFRWNPPCRPQTYDTHAANGSSSRPPKVLMIGDSLTWQLFSTCQHLARSNTPYKEPCIYEGIEFYGRLERMILMKSNPFEPTPFASKCESVLNQPSDPLYRWYTNEELHGILHDFDYIIYNSFAWWSKLFDLLLPCYETELENGKNGSFNFASTSYLLKKDLMDFNKRQINTFAKFASNWNTHSLSDAKYDRTTRPRFYYRTSSPHSVPWTTHPSNRPNSTKPFKGEEPLSFVPEPFTAEECLQGEAARGPKYLFHKYLLTCVSLVNEIATEAFRMHLGPGSILDTAPAMALRVDAHPRSFRLLPGHENWKSKLDSLHFCIPGPVSDLLDAIITEILARENEVNEE